EIPELPLEKKERFINTYKLPEYDASILVSNVSSANFFENTIKQFENITEKTSKSIANWINVEGGRLLNEKNIDVEKSQLTPASLVKLITMLERNELNSNTAKTIFDSIYTSGGDPAEIAQEMGLIQITDSETIESAIDVVLNNNPEAITDYLQGKESVIQFLMGQVMKETKGKANPKMAIPSIKEKLEKFK
ncbi:MAG: Asp-tRNA(Asn)/Glu-tRNA(Gln) amidotransferase GatCAB subunit B, partial [Dehalococcoidia bacterium]|nr:Asp-tRNA(Asn)/Glu-tRNA(Gln) amidotransferase GatCAB subunit B [Dehalococcoidia bacterium]